MLDLKKRMQDGEHLTGTMINVIDTLDIVKILRQCVFDYIVIDNEHGAFDISKVSAMVSLCNEMDLGVIIRIPDTRRDSILKYMEMGADGLMLPDCQNVEGARELVRHAKYPPMGNRGVSLTRGHSRYIPVKSPKDYMYQQNHRTLLIVQIESAEGVGNIDSILEVDGIDIAFIGSNDLSVNLNVAGQFDSPTFKNAVKNVLNATVRHNKYCGIHSMTAEGLDNYRKQGMIFNIYANEVAMLMDGAALMKTI